MADRFSQIYPAIFVFAQPKRLDTTVVPCPVVSESIDMESLEYKLNSQIGQKIRQRRKDLSLSQTDIARFLGVTYQQVHKIEKGINRISAARLALLSSYLGVKSDYFFDQIMTQRVG